jgi:hypothetical protein
MLFRSQDSVLLTRTYVSRPRNRTQDYGLEILGRSQKLGYSLLDRHQAYDHHLSSLLQVDIHYGHKYNENIIYNNQFEGKVFMLVSHIKILHQETIVNISLPFDQLHAFFAKI